MAIKEFIIGPQNYFEEGYFDGDYTQPNVSKSFLECDIDNIKGGRVVTGLYYEDNYIDGTYWHDNSIRATLSVDVTKIKDIYVSMQEYYEEGYYEGSYIASRGSFFTISASGSLLIETDATLTSTVTQSTEANAIKEFDSALTVTATMQTIGSRFGDIDMIAFAEGQLSTLALVIRNYEISASAQFDIAVDYVRQRQADSDADSVVTIVIDNERYREFDSAQQVAFSFAVAETKFRPGNADLTASTALSAIISHIEGADILAENFASMSCDSVITADAEIVTNSQTALITVINVIFNNSANLFSYFGLLTSRFFGTGRPRNLVTQTYINKAKFGSYSLNASVNSNLTYVPTTPKVNEDWVFEGFAYREYTSFILNQGVTIQNEWISFLLGYTTTGTPKFTARYINSSLQTINFVDQSVTISNDVWYHLLIVKNSSRLSVYFNGNRLFTTTTLPSSYRNDYGLIQIGSTPGIWYVDEVSLRIGDTYGYNPDSTTITIPTSARTNSPEYTQFLYHFENNSNDDAGVNLLQTTSAGLIARATLTATLSGTQEFATLQAAQATLTANVGFIKQADSSLVSEATQTTQADRIRITDTALSFEFTQSASADRTRTDSADLNSEATLSFAIGIIKTADIDTDAVATQLTAVGRIGDFFINCESQFTQSTTVVKTTDVISTQSSEFTQTADGIIEVSAEADLTATATQITDGARIRFGVSDIVEDSSAVIADVNYIADAEAGIEFDVIASTEITTQGLIGVECDLVVTTNIEITAVKITDIDSSLDAVSNFNTSADRLRTTETVLESEFTSSADASAVRDVSIVTDSIATQLSAVAKIADFFINAESQFVLNIDAVKTVDIQSAQDAIATQETLAFKLHSTAESDLLSEFTQVSVAFVGAVGNADIGAVFTTQSSAVVIFDAVGSLTAIASLECDVDIIRGAAALQMVVGDLFVDTRRFRGITQEITAQASLTCTPNFIFGGEVTIAGAMTATIAIRAIHIDIYVYKIPGETRAYTISGDNRNYAIIGEDRSYTIRR